MRQCVSTSFRIAPSSLQPRRVGVIHPQSWAHNGVVMPTSSKRPTPPPRGNENTTLWISAGSSWTLAFRGNGLLVCLMCWRWTGWSRRVKQNQNRRKKEMKQGSSLEGKEGRKMWTRYEENKSRRTNSNGKKEGGYGRKRRRQK